LAEFIFEHKFTNHVPRMMYVKYQNIWNESMIKSSKIHQILAILGPNRCQPLDFRKLESPFPKE